MAEGLFNSHLRDSQPLSLELMRRADDLQRRIDRAKVLDDLTPLEADELASTLEGLRPVSPKLLGIRAGSQRAGDYRWNADRSAKVRTTRYYVAVGVEGDIELLRYWPDAGPSDLVPVDADIVAEIDRTGGLAHGSPEQVGRYWTASQIWQIGAVNDDVTEPEFCLYTYFDATLEEEHAFAVGDVSLADIFQRRRDFIAPIVQAVAQQTDEFFDSVLPARVRSVVAAKRRELENRSAVSESLVFPDGWRFSPPELAPVNGDAYRSVAGRAKDVPVSLDSKPPVPDSVDVIVDRRARLDSATFEDVQTIMRLWVDAVERYPAAFGPLEEDRLSDLLAATLNANVPGAQREVYTRGGKSDIYISADAIRSGHGPARVFVCETKWATSHKVIREALDPQLFGYLNIHDTAAVLLVLLPQKNFAKARRVYQDLLEDVPGYVDFADGPVDGWPILRYARDGNTVRVCVAFVHLPR